MFLVWLLPKNMISRWMGKLASLKLPIFFRKPFLTWFGQIFGVDFSEIAEPLENFNSLQSFFTRALKPGLRPLDAGSVVSPCDGAFGQCGSIQSGQLLQIKGRPYALNQLLGEEANELQNGYFTTIYLSPKDYHRFHMPISAPVTKVRYLPGNLWPVNAWAVKNISKLFCVNERMVCWLGEHTVLVAVGATMVGKVKLTFDASLSTNVKHTRGVLKSYGPAAPVLEKGAELGWFEFGSTIILITKEPLEVTSFGGTIKMGTRLRG